MAWLLRDGDVLAALDDGREGWPASIQGAMVKRGPVLVHTLTTSAGRDLAWCRDSRTDTGEVCLQVRRIACLAPRRLARPLLKAGAVVVAEPGAFERWNLQVGDRLEIRDG
jgi:hypothetical protein